jgi:hypothetical protein
LPEPTPAERHRDHPMRVAHSVTCEGCGCVLDSDGMIISRGAGIEAHLAAQDTIRDLKKEIGRLQEKIDALTPAPVVVVERRSPFPW